MSPINVDFASSGVTPKSGPSPVLKMRSAKNTRSAVPNPDIETENIESDVNIDATVTSTTATKKRRLSPLNALKSVASKLNEAVTGPGGPLHRVDKSYGHRAPEGGLDKDAMRHFQTLEHIKT